MTKCKQALLLTTTLLALARSVGACDLLRRCSRGSHAGTQHAEWHTATAARAASPQRGLAQVCSMNDHGSPVLSLPLYRGCS